MRGHNIARLNHTANVVDRIFGHRKTAVRRPDQHPVNFPGRRIDVEPVNLGPRRHHFADRTVGHPHDTGHDGAFMLFDHAGTRGFGKHHLQFIGGDMAGFVALHPQHPEDQRAAIVEQPDQRRRDASEQIHRRGHDDRDPLCRTQGNLLGDQLADHQRGISGQADHQYETDGARQIRTHAQQLQPLCRRTTKACAGKSAGDNADQGYPDLHGGQELAGIAGQPQRGLGSAIALIGKAVQIRLACRDNRQFRHGKYAIDQHQQNNDRDVKPGKGCHIVH